MSDKIHGFLPAAAEMPSDNQRLFLRYFTGVLINLLVLNLFAEYWSLVKVETFTISLVASVVLQVLLKLTIAIEHHVAGLFKGGSGALMKFLRYTSAWVILFASKFAILGTVTLLFGDTVRFEGPYHGVVALIVVVVTMIVAEELVVRLYRKIG